MSDSTLPVNLNLFGSKFNIPKSLIVGLPPEGHAKFVCCHVCTAEMLIGDVRQSVSLQAGACALHNATLCYSIATL
jgi:hypothetical protein